MVLSLEGHWIKIYGDGAKGTNCVQLVKQLLRICKYISILDSSALVYCFQECVTTLGKFEARKTAEILLYSAL